MWPMYSGADLVINYGFCIFFGFNTIRVDCNGNDFMIQTYFGVSGISFYCSFCMISRNERGISLVGGVYCIVQIYLGPSFGKIAGASSYLVYTGVVYFYDEYSRS